MKQKNPKENKENPFPIDDSQIFIKSFVVGMCSNTLILQYFVKIFEYDY